MSDLADLRKKLMRIIGGSVRGRRLTEFKGESIRPTTDRVREALFSMLHSRLGPMTDFRVLDLFAGSGALGIEALSRGAASACFVDKDDQAIRTIRSNLEHCGLADRAQILQGDVLSSLQKPSAQGPFDLVFMDPPYGRDLAARILEEVDSRDILASAGLVCLETGSKDIVPLRAGRLQRIVQRRYGSSMLHLFSQGDL